MTEIRDVAPGLAIWRVPHHHWQEGAGWAPPVTGVRVVSRAEVAVIDPIVPAEDEDELWDWLDATPPTLAVVLKPDHVRDVDRVVQRYHCPAYGPDLFFRDDLPLTDLIPLHAGDSLPGGLMAHGDGREHHETPLWLPDQRTLVFADALTERAGQLRIWSTPYDEEGPRRALRRLLDLPIERVIISHGEPVHGRAAFERALDLAPFREDEES